MITTVGQLRTLLCETRAMTGMWVQDVLYATQAEVDEVVFRPESAATREQLERLLTRMGCTDDQSYHVCSEWLNILRWRAKWGHATSVPSSYIEDFETALARVSRKKQTKVRLLTSTASTKDTHDYVACTVTDLVGHIGLTIEENPDAVWMFDRETLELDHVPTYYEAVNQGSGPCRIARLRDIEGGRI